MSPLEYTFSKPLLRKRHFTFTSGQRWGPRFGPSGPDTDRRETWSRRRHRRPSRPRGRRVLVRAALTEPKRADTPTSRPIRFPQVSGQDTPTVVNVVGPPLRVLDWWKDVGVTPSVCFPIRTYKGPLPVPSPRGRDRTHTDGLTCSTPIRVWTHRTWDLGAEKGTGPSGGLTPGHPSRVLFDPGAPGLEELRSRRRDRKK